MPPKRDVRLRIVGGAVRAIREARGIPAGRFARDLGISPSHLSNIELRAYQPSWRVLVGMASRLGVAVDAITYNVDNLARDAQLVDEANEAAAVMSPWDAVS